MSKYDENDEGAEMRNFAWREPFYLSAGFAFFLFLPLADQRATLQFNIGAYQHLAGFEFLPLLVVRLLIIHSVFFFIHFTIAQIFRPKPWIYSTLFILYTFLYVFVYYPHLLLDYFTYSFVANLPLFATPLWVKTCGLALAGYLAYLAWNRRRHWALILPLALALHVVWLNDPYLTFESGKVTLPPSTAHNPRSIIMIGIDGMRAESFRKLAGDDRHPYLSRYLKEAKTFPLVITPVARTFPALYSLLTGKSPAESGIRGNLELGSENTDRLFSDAGNLTQLKNLGYEMTLGLSEADYAVYKQGKIFDKVLSPSPGLHNFLLAQYLRDPLLFAWLNNALGLKFIPEAIGNAAMFDTWWPQIFRNRVLQDLSQVPTSSRPQFKLYHHGRPHFPGANPYPYFHRREMTPFATSPFAYAATRDFAFQFSPIGTIDVEENIRTYEEGVAAVADTYLEDIFSELYRSNLIDNAVIVLYSDHGESFFNGELLPIGKFPRHGSGLMFGDDSERAFFAIHSPVPLSDAELEKPLSLQDALNIAIPLAQAPNAQEAPTTFVRHEIYSESDRWMAPTFPTQLVTGLESADDIQLDDENLPYFSLSPRDQASKQRASYEYPYRLTLYLDRVGFQIHLENLQSDQHGNTVSLENRELVDRLFAKIKASFKQDFESGALPDLKINWQSASPHILEWRDSFESLLANFARDPVKYQWQLLWRSKSEFHGSFMVLTSTRALLALAHSPVVEADVKCHAEADLFEEIALLGESIAYPQAELKNSTLPSACPRSLRRRWTIMKILALKRLNADAEIKPMLEPAIREFGPIMEPPPQNASWLKRALTEQLVTLRIPARLYALLFNPFKISTLNWSETERMLLDTFTMMFGPLEKPLQNDAMQSFLTSTRHQFKYKLFGINDEWYRELIFNMPRERFDASLQVLSLALRDPYLGFETMVLLEQMTFPDPIRMRNGVAWFGEHLAAESLGARDKHELYRSYLDLRSGFQVKSWNKSWWPQDIEKIKLLKTRIKNEVLAAHLDKVMHRAADQMKER